METRDIIYISAEVIVGVVSVIGNSIVLAAIVKTQRLHTITNVFVGNLAVADIVVGLLVAPCAGVSFLGLPPNFYGCVFINCLILMFTNVSILMLLAVAIERFIAIKEPFVYQRVLTLRRAIYVNLLVWLLGSLLGLMPMYGWHNGYHEIEYCMFVDVITYQYMVYFQFFGLVLLPLFIMLCIYIYILLIVRRHMRQTNALNNLFRQGNQPRQGFNKDVRAAKMFALVILLFGVFWLPVNIFNCVSLFCKSACTFPYEGLLVAIVMSHANSTINPFLYAATNSRIKQAIKGLFGITTHSGDRSSTDQPHPRPSNGISRVRDNTIRPTSTVDNTRPFTITQDAFHVSNGKKSPNDMQANQSAGDVTLSNLNSDHVRNGGLNSDHVRNGGSKLPSDEIIYQHEGGDTSQHQQDQAAFVRDNGQPQTSQPPPISAWQVKGEETPVSDQLSLQQEQLSALLQLPATSSEERTKETSSPPVPVSSTIHPLYNGHPPYGHSNPAFVSDDSANNVKDKKNNDRGSETQDNGVYAISEETDKMSGPRPPLTSNAWCEPDDKPSERNQDSAHERTNSALSPRQSVSSPPVVSRPSSFADQPADTCAVKKLRSSSSSITSLSSLSGPRSSSIEELGLLEVNGDHSHTSVKKTRNHQKYHHHQSSEFYTQVDELRILTNSRTEHTKL